VMSRGVKPILGLIVLLAWPLLGLGGRAEASFALGRLSRQPERSGCSVGFELALVLNGQEQTEASEARPRRGMRTETPSAPDGNVPNRVFPRGPLPADGDLQTGTSSGPVPPTGAGVGAGLSLLPPHVPLLADDASGLLFLAFGRLRPPLFPSRLFRPPRMNLWYSC